MSSILVVEQEDRYRAQIQDALGAGGWRIRMFHEAGPALQSASAEKPDLVIVGADVPGVEMLASSYSRSAGGRVLGLLPEDATEAGVGGIEADDLLAKPFSGPELRTLVQRALDAQQRPAVPAAPPAHRGGGVMLTSHDIFGDVLAEVEGDEPAPPPPMAPAAPVAPPAAAAPRPAPAPRPSRDDDDDVNRRLEKTLTGVFGFGAEPKPRPAAPAPPPVAQTAAPAPAPPPKPAAQRRPELADEDVDALINKTLSKLDLGARSRPAVPAAAPARTAADRGLSELEEMTRSFRRPELTPPAPAPAPAQAPVETPPVEAQIVVQAAVPVVAPVALPSEPEPEPEPVLEEPPVLEEFPFVLEPELEPEPEPVLEAAPEVIPEVIPEPLADPPSDELLIEALPDPPDVPEWPPAPPLPPLHSLQSSPRSVTDDIAATQRIQIPPPAAARGVLEVPAEPQEQTFGQYTLLDKIAAGGMAEVWKARMRGVEGFQKTVAIKKILPHMTDNAEFVGMFIDEAKLAAQLSHPNIVHIYDLGKIGRDYYIAMEYVEGRDLRSLMNAGRRRRVELPVELALLIAARIASALDYAHRKRDFEDRELGLVHRDVSPQNVLISYEGDVKLCDFGIAKAVSKAGQTQMGALKGKLQYMSPEQAWGRAVDFRSDLFSLGAVLFEMLTGERLFTGDSELSVLEAVRQGQIRPTRQINPAIPQEVEEIVARALAYEPQNRFASAGEMKQRIEAALHGMKVSPGPTDLAAHMDRVYADDVPSGEFSFAWPAVDETSQSASQPLAPESATTDFAPGAPAEPLAEAPLAAVAPVGEVHVEETGGRQSRTMLYAGIGLLLLIAILTFWLLSRREAPPPPAEPAATAPAAAPAAAPVPPPVSAQPSPAPTPQIDVKNLVSQEMARREAELRRKMEAEERKLRKELARVQAENREAEKRQPDSAPEAAPEATPPPRR